MSGTGKNYMSAQEATEAVTWTLPQVGRGQRIPSAEKEARERKQREAEQAKERVEDVEPLTLPSAEEIAGVMDAARQDGYQEGYQAGQAQGLEEGRALGQQQAYQEAQAETQRLQQTLQQLIADLSGPAESRQQSLASLLVTLVKRVAQKLVFTELSTPSQHIENLVQACIQQLPPLQRDARATISVHPDDLAYLHGESLMSDVIARCEWVADDSIAQGGCRVTTPASQLDATTEARLAAVLSAFEQGQLALAGDQEDGTELAQDIADSRGPDADPSATGGPHVE
jgi:flagellar assembly protein FliH